MQLATMARGAHVFHRGTLPHAEPWQAPAGVKPAGSVLRTRAVRCFWCFSRCCNSNAVSSRDE